MISRTAIARQPAGEHEPTAASTGAELLVSALEAQGVSVVFAYPGGASLGLHQALAQSARIRTVLPRHEQGAVFAAEGFARASGRAGVCIATSGPGATNLVTGIADAFMDSIPLVALTGQVPKALIGKGAFQEIDVVSVVRPICKHVRQLRAAAEVPEAIAQAFEIAQAGRPGPVVLDLPKDVLAERIIGVAATGAPLVMKSPMPAPAPGVAAAIIDRLASAQRPVIFAGGGVISAGACEALHRFAELTGIPVVTSLMGIGAFPESHPLSARWLGMHGAAYANWAVDQADMLITFGARFDDRVTGRLDRFCPRAFVVHVDVDARELGKNKAADIPVHADARAMLEGLVECLKRRDSEPLRARFAAWRLRIDTWKSQAPFRWGSEAHSARREHLAADVTADDVVLPQLVISRLHALTQGKAIVTTGVGQHQMWAAQFYPCERPRQLLTSGGLGAMGFGYPAALGAKLACPEAEVIDIDGDGSFLMNIQELATARTEGINVKAIVLDNQHLGMVFQMEDHLFEGTHAHVFLGNAADRTQAYPDFVGLARGFGVAAERVQKASELDAALRRMLAAKEPYLLHVLTPYAADVLPYIKPGGCVDEMIY